VLLIYTVAPVSVCIENVKSASLSHELFTKPFYNSNFSIEAPAKGVAHHSMNTLHTPHPKIDIRLFTISCSLLMLLLGYSRSKAQCTDWGIKAQLTSASTCAANAGFTVSIYGPDAANLTNVQYSIPTTPSGFFVPPNNSSSFSNIPPGTYTVSAIADCNGNPTGKNTTITIPGAYTAPSLSVSQSRTSLSCGNYGKLTAYITKGAPPYTIKLTSAPTSYTGPVSFTTSSQIYTINDLAAGSYTVQLIDACGSGSNIVTTAISSIMVASVPLIYSEAMNSGCDTILIPKPAINTNIAGWFNYDADNLFKASIQIGGGLLPTPTPYDYFNSPPFALKIPAGKSLKDYYGQTIYYTIQPPCGNAITGTHTIPYPYVSPSVTQNCNTDFTATLYFNGAICYPLSYTVTNTATGISYGPYSTSSPVAVTPNLPIGSYSLTYTTGDGYTGNSSFATSIISANPYSVQAGIVGDGLDGYIDWFIFTSSVALGTKTVELFNGPPGYSFLGTWTSNTIYGTSDNQTPGAGTLKYKPGTYVWKITDNCGTYYLPITVSQTDVYRFTAGIDSQKRTCAGLRVWPSVTGMVNNTSVATTFSLLKDGEPYPKRTPLWVQYPAGSSVLLTDPGVYTIVPSAAIYTVFLDLPYPNDYTATWSFTYSVQPVQADMNQTQGFVCTAANTGQAKIYIQGKDGMPNKNGGTHYTYYLAAHGNGISGPYIANNTTGVFTNFGGNANDMYDVKIVDSCGAFAVQSVKILDLQSTRLLTSTGYASCEHDTLELTALYLPGATYSWSGPNGFTSAIRNPVIKDISPASAGVYKVTITTASCSQLLIDSITIAVNPNPVKPIVSVSCSPSPTTLYITNGSAAYRYDWHINILIGSFTYPIVEPSDFNYGKYAYLAGGYTAWAIDTTTGCKTPSDSIYFGHPPNAKVTAHIYSPHLQVCSGDSTILVAMGSIAGSYQWFKNGMPIPGATGKSLVTGSAGNYKVSIDAGPCNKDTSSAVAVSVVSIPVANITSSATDICRGQSALLNANTGTGYSYTWHKDSISIPQANSAQLSVDTTGSYFVTISNGGCVANSSSIRILVHDKPSVHLVPDTDQSICTGDSLQLSSIADASYTYSWYRDGNKIAGAATNTFWADTTGSYLVKVHTAYCPDSTSNIVKIMLLPVSLSLGRDTIICDTENFSMVLHVPDGFDNILWSDGSTGNDLSINKGGKYWVNANNKCGSFSDTIDIYKPENYLPDLPGDTVICNENNYANFNLSPLLDNITWNTGAHSHTLHVTYPGVFWVQASSPCGMVYDTTNVHFCLPDIQTIALSKDTICESDCIEYHATVGNYPQKYKWLFEGGNPATDSGSSTSRSCYYLPGIYKTTLMASNAGGTVTKATNIIVLPKPVLNFTDTGFTVPYKSMLVLPASAEAEQSKWMLNDSLVCENCRTLTVEARLWHQTYTCILTNAGCSSVAHYHITTTDIPSDIWFPTAFSPNGDGLNDYFRVITDNPNINVITLAVYNRFGQVIYNGHQGDKGWDGTYKGQKVDIGTYFWQVKYKVNGQDKEYFLKGDITVL